MIDFLRYYRIYLSSSATIFISSFIFHDISTFSFVCFHLCIFFICSSSFLSYFLPSVSLASHFALLSPFHLCFRQSILPFILVSFPPSLPPSPSSLLNSLPLSLPPSLHPSFHLPLPPTDAVSITDCPPEGCNDIFVEWEYMDVCHDVTHLKVTLGDDSFTTTDVTATNTTFEDLELNTQYNTCIFGLDRDDNVLARSCKSCGTQPEGLCIMWLPVEM